MTRSMPASERSRRAGRRRRTVRALAVGLVLSAGVHAALLLAPPLAVETPEHLAAAGRLQVLPPPKEPPPEVEVPPPAEPVTPPAEPELVTGGQPVPADDAEPTFVPHDVPPRLINPDEVQQYLRVFYPMTLRMTSDEGAVHLWLFVDEQGRATRLQVRSSSGSDQFDRLARSAAPLMKFRPALNQGNRVGVWVSLWVRFNLEEPELRQAADRQVASERNAGETED